MSKCIDPELSVLIHAYELNAISEEDREAFELHLMRCDHCFREVEQMQDAMRIMRADPAISELAEASLGVRRTSRPGRLRAWVWPDAPLIFRPALALLVILLLLYPASIGLFSHRDTPSVSQPLAVHLFPTRSGAATLPGDRDVVLSFVVESAMPDRSYRIEIRDDGGNVEYRDQNFRGFDDYGTGVLLIGAGSLPPGTYTLTVRNSDGDDGLPLETYKLTVAS